MAEKSIFWTTGTEGDGANPYTEAEVVAWLRRTFGSGVLYGYGDGLVVSGTSSPVSIATGAASVDGFPYESDAAVQIAIPTPAANTRVDRIVVRANWSARTCRITRIAGTEGAGPPSLTQNRGSIWDMPLASVSITTGGVITVTDEREFAHFTTQVVTENLANGAVTDAKLATAAVTNAKIADDSISTGRIANNAVTDDKLRDSVSLSVIGRSANSSGDPADIVAGADGAVLRRAGATLGFGQVSTAGIANDAVDDTKVGNRVPQVYRRQGGSSSNWSTSGNNNYTPGAVRMQVGARKCTSVNGFRDGQVAITFPVPFSAPPLIFLSLTWRSTDLGWIMLSANPLYTSSTGFEIGWSHQNPGDGVQTFDVAWLAIGPE